MRLYICDGRIGLSYRTSDIVLGIKEKYTVEITHTMK